MTILRLCHCSSLGMRDLAASPFQRDHCYNKQLSQPAIGYPTSSFIPQDLTLSTHSPPVQRKLPHFCEMECGQGTGVGQGSGVDIASHPIHGNCIQF